MLLRVLPYLAVTAALFGPASSQGFADFRVCNRSSIDSIDVAFGVQRGRNGWESEGWFTVRRRQCATLIVGDLRQRYYYLYGVSGDTVWDGEDDNDGSDFCVRPGGVFKLNDNSLKNNNNELDCEGHGYEIRKFLQVDTGDAESFTFDFVD